MLAVKKSLNHRGRQLGEKNPHNNQSKTRQAGFLVKVGLGCKMGEKLKLYLEVALSWKNIAISRTAIRSSFLAQERSIRKDTLIDSKEGSKKSHE